MLNELATIPQLDQLPAFIVQSQLDGSNGTNRAEASLCQIRANNDYDAIHCWLNEYKQTQATYRSYQKETERLLLWCVIQYKKSLSSLDKEDLENYFEFLSDPQPKGLWCGKKGGYGKTRGSVNWKPFSVGLSASAKATAISIINSLFQYLVMARYLQFNPFDLMKNKKKFFKNQQASEFTKVKVLERILEEDEWNAMIETLESYPEETPHQKDDKSRLRLLVHLLFFLGIRISELENSTWQSFRELQEKWWFFVIGKGGKFGKIPVNTELLETVKSYREHMNFSFLPSSEEQTPILCNWHTGKPLTARYMNKLLKALAFKTAEKFKDRPKKAEKLKCFSAHWLRHLSATMQDQAGISFKHIKENHRHSRDDTTRIYVHAFDEARHEDMEKLKLIGDSKHF